MNIPMQIDVLERQLNNVLGQNVYFVYWQFCIHCNLALSLLVSDLLSIEDQRLLFQSTQKSQVRLRGFARDYYGSYICI